MNITVILTIATNYDMKSNNKLDLIYKRIITPPCIASVFSIIWLAPLFNKLH